MVPGFENVMADLYWLRTVQYFGGQRVFAREKRFDLLQPLVDITTTLDRKFEIAYRYGASFLAEPYPIGAGKPEEAVALLERGAANLPRSWLLRQNLGFYAYFFLRDSSSRRGCASGRARSSRERRCGWRRWPPTSSARVATARPRAGCGPECTRIRKRDLSSGTHKVRCSAWTPWITSTSSTGWWSSSRTGEAAGPASFHELGQAGLLPFQPVDPTGVPFHYDPQQGKVEIHADVDPLADARASRQRPEMTRRRRSVSLNGLTAVAPSRENRAAILAFLTAGVMLFVQILVHRIISVKLLNNYAFLVISLTMLGLALSGVILSRTRPLFLRHLERLAPDLLGGIRPVHRDRHRRLLSRGSERPDGGQPVGPHPALPRLAAPRPALRAALHVLWPHPGQPPLRSPPRHPPRLLLRPASARRWAPSSSSPRSAGWGPSARCSWRAPRRSWAACSCSDPARAAVRRPGRALARPPGRGHAWGENRRSRCATRRARCWTGSQRLPAPLGLEHVAWDPIARIEVSRVNRLRAADSMPYPELIGEDRSFHQRFERLLTQNNYAFTYAVHYTGPESAALGAHRHGRTRTPATSSPCWSRRLPFAPRRCGGSWTGRARAPSSRWWLPPQGSLDPAHPYATFLGLDDPRQEAVHDPRGTHSTSLPHPTIAPSSSSIRGGPHLLSRDPIVVASVPVMEMSLLLLSVVVGLAAVLCVYVPLRYLGRRKRKRRAALAIWRVLRVHRGGLSADERSDAFP